MQWRERGLAFEIREGIYQVTNPTLLSSKVFSQVGMLFEMQDNNRMMLLRILTVCVHRWGERLL